MSIEIRISHYFFVVATLIECSNSFAGVCEEVDRQPATQALGDLVVEDRDLRNSLQESIDLGQRINSDPRSNPVTSLEDYYAFIDALVTYDPRNLETGLGREGIRISMDGKNYCNWNILDILSYSYFLVDRQLTTDPRGQIQFENAKFSDWMRQVAESWGAYLETPASAKYVPDFENDPTFGGSDFVIIFEEKAKFRLTVLHAASVSPGAGVNYQPSLQGQKYGCFGFITDCSARPELPPPYPK